MAAPSRFFYLLLAIEHHFVLAHHEVLRTRQLEREIVVPRLGPGLAFQRLAYQAHDFRRRHSRHDLAEALKRLKALESENARLRKLLVDRELEIDVMKEINAKKW